MMTTVYIDPIHGAALTAGLLPILPGLPCPTCRGTGWRCRNSNLMCTHRVHQGCEDCTGSGVWTPPDHPVTTASPAQPPMRCSTKIMSALADAERLKTALRLTAEYVGPELLPPIEGWSWYDALEQS